MLVPDAAVFTVESMQAQSEKLAIPRRYGGDMKEIWALQARFENRSGRRPFQLLEHLKFRAAYDFLLLRCESGELDGEIAEWWKKFAAADEVSRNSLLLKEGAAGPAKRRRRRRRRKPAAGGDAKSAET